MRGRRPAPPLSPVAARYPGQTGRQRSPRRPLHLTNNGETQTMMPKRIPLILLILPLLFASAAFAGFEDAIEASQAGDRAAAFEGFREAAEQGDTRAFGKLAGMYLYGSGTDRNYEQAFLWFGLARLAGDQYAEAFQNAAATRLTRDRIEALEQAIDRRARRFGLVEEGGPGGEVPTLGEIIKQRGGVFGPEIRVPEADRLPSLDAGQ